MSTAPTPLPPNQSPVFPKIDWKHVLLAVITAILGTIQVLPKPLPVPVPPAPVVIVEPPAPVVPPRPPVVVPPTPLPFPEPLPVPEPVLPPVPKPEPVPVPDDHVVPPSPIIETGITVKDSLGHALGNSADAGTLFTVAAPSGVFVTATSPLDGGCQVIQYEGITNQLDCVLKPGGKLNVIITSAKVPRPNLFTIVCNQGPQPPPVVVVPPTPVVPPVPVTPPVIVPPKPIFTGSVTIGIVEPDVDMRTKSANQIMTHIGWKKYRAAGHKVYFWAEKPPSSDQAAVHDIAALKAANLPSPGYVVRDAAGNVLHTASFAEDFQAVATDLQPFTGMLP